MNSPRSDTHSQPRSRRNYRGLFLCAIGASVLAAAAVGTQAPLAGALSDTLRAHVRDARFQVVTSIRGLPLGVRDELETLFGGELDIAEPGAEFQVNDRGGRSKLPTRRLVAAGCSNSFYCLVYYERGGNAHTWHVMLFHWTPKATRFEWGGTAPAGLATLDEVRKAVVSGAIKSANTRW